MLTVWPLGWGQIYYYYFFCQPPLAVFCINTLWFVIGCKQSGVYGTKCDNPCSITCKDSTCNIVSGACFDCEHGVYGRYCNLSCPANCMNNTCHMQNGSCMECRPGVYGSYCNQSCSINCKDKTCHMQSGTCLTCVSGWTGMYCNTSNVYSLYRTTGLYIGIVVIILKLSLMWYSDNRSLAKRKLFTNQYLFGSISK